MIFRGKTIDGKPCVSSRDAINAECSKHRQFTIDVRKYDEAAEISRQQMKYWHAMPIRLYSEYTGETLWKSEQILKRECGEQWFMIELEPECNKRGSPMFECLNPHCRDLFLLPCITEKGNYICRKCQTINIRIFFMVSKTELKVNDFTQVLQNMFDYMESINCPCSPPNKDWKIEKK